MARDRYYSTQTGNSGSSPIGVGYYSIYDPQWTQLMAAGLKEAQKRWDTAETTIAAAQDQLYNLPVDPNSQEAILNLVTDMTNNLEKDINDKFGGDYGRALNYIKDYVIKARKNIIPVTKQAYEQYNRAYNTYSALEAQGKAPVKYKYDENGSLVPVKVGFNELYKTPLIKVDDNGVARFNPNLPQIRAREDYSPTIGDAVKALNTRYWSGESLMKDKDSGTVVGTKTSTVRGYSREQFEKFLNTDKGKEWTNEFINYLKQRNPGALNEFDNEEDLKKFFLDSVRAQLFGSSATSLTYSGPRNNGDNTTTFDPLDMLPSTAVTPTFESPTTVIKSIYGDLPTSTSGEWKETKWHPERQTKQIESLDVKDNDTLYIDSNGLVYRYTTRLKQGTDSVSAETKLTPTGINITPFKNFITNEDYGIVEMGQPEEINGKKVTPLKVQDSAKLKSVLSNGIKKLSTTQVPRFSIPNAATNKSIVLGLYSSDVLKPEKGDSEVPSNKIDGLIISPIYKDTVFVKDTEGNLHKYKITEARLVRLLDTGNQMYGVMYNTGELKEVSTPAFPVRIGNRTIMVDNIKAASSNINDYSNNVIVRDAKSGEEIVVPSSQVGNLLENYYRFVFGTIQNFTKKQN